VRVDCEWGGGLLLGSTGGKLLRLRLRPGGGGAHPLGLSGGGGRGSGNGLEVGEPGGGGGWGGGWGGDRAPLSHGGRGRHGGGGGTGGLRYGYLVSLSLLPEFPVVVGAKVTRGIMDIRTVTGVAYPGLATDGSESDCEKKKSPHFDFI
jgi:hypothetical protein